MKTLKSKWIIYDGNCGLCLNSKKYLSQLGIIPEEQCLDYYSLSEKHLDKIEAEHFRYEMALIDENSDDTMYGLRAILYIFAARFPWLQKVSLGKLGFRIIDFFYHTISFNRYFLFPIERRAFKCDCEPPLVKKYFISWVVLGALVALVISTLLGLVMAKHLNLSSWQGISQILLIVGSGWVVQLGLGMLFQKRESFNDYLRHLSLIMSAGVFVLLPSLLLAWLPTNIFLPLLGFNVLLSSGLMLKMHLKRMKFMRLSQGWSLSWFLALQSTALFWVLYFQPWML